MDDKKLTESLNKLKNESTVESKTLLERVRAMKPQPPLSKAEAEAEEAYAMLYVHGPVELAKSELTPVDVLNGTLITGSHTSQSSKSGDDSGKGFPKNKDGGKIETNLSRLKRN